MSYRTQDVGSLAGAIGSYAAELVLFSKLANAATAGAHNLVDAIGRGTVKAVPQAVSSDDALKSVERLKRVLDSHVAAHGANLTSDSPDFHHVQKVRQMLTDKLEGARKRLDVASPGHPAAKPPAPAASAAPAAARPAAAASDDSPFGKYMVAGGGLGLGGFVGAQMYKQPGRKKRRSL